VNILLYGIFGYDYRHLNAVSYSTVNNKILFFYFVYKFYLKHFTFWKYFSEILS